MQSVVVIPAVVAAVVAAVVTAAVVWGGDGRGGH